MVLSPLARAVAIVGGYVAAFCAGSAAVWLKNRGVSEADQLAMSGMYAFGDAVTFLGVGAVASIPPTLLLAQVIGRAPGFWRFYAGISLVLAATGLVEAFFLLAPPLWQPGLAHTLHLIAPLRVLSGPLFLLLYAPGLLPIAGPNRRWFLLACLMEVVTLSSFAVLVIGSR